MKAINKFKSSIKTLKNEYHKGKACVIERAILCQEGYCSNCWIKRIQEKPEELADVI